MDILYIFGIIISTIIFLYLIIKYIKSCLINSKIKLIQRKLNKQIFWFMQLKKNYHKMLEIFDKCFSIVN